MGHADYYKHGDWNVICDECGFKFKASECCKRWDGFFVCSMCWEPRHPQDYVRSKHDKQRVPIARPDPSSVVGTTAVKVAGSRDDTSIDVDSISNMAIYDGVGITLDGYGGVFFTSHRAAPSGDTIYLAEPLPGPAAVDNVVYIMGQGDVSYLTTNEVTVASLG